MRSIFAVVIVFIWNWNKFIEGMKQFQDKQQGVFTSVKGKYLKGSVIDQRTVTSPLECSLYCIRSRLCMSLNFKLAGSFGGVVCELNNATRVTSPHQDKTDYLYFEPRVKNLTSCLDHLRNGANKNGVYTITDTSGDSYQVFCDVTSEPRSAWTLIQSYSVKNRVEHVFCRGSFASNLPIKENSPNWERYRLALQRMKSLSDQSTHWRSTTGFEKYGVDYTDYVRGKISNMDILSSTVMHGACKAVEYVNIRGIKGANIKANFWQQINVYPLHIDSIAAHCDYKSYVGATGSENDFGYYCMDVMNPKFRGSMNEDSTTQ